MFNKNLFDRNAFNRNVSSSAISLPMIAGGALSANITIQFALVTRPIEGTSAMKCAIVMKQQLGSVMVGIGALTNETTYLSMAIRPVRLSGSGRVIPNVSVHTPFRGDLKGSGVVNVDSRMYLLQYITALLQSSGELKLQPILQNPLPMELSGTSTLKGSPSILLPISSDFIGVGDIILRRLSAVNENALELIDINLLPGETVIIDTGLLQVLFGTKEDVSSVTSDSIFFELNPGENEITISSETDTTFDVTAVWQNLWL